MNCGTFRLNAATLSVALVDGQRVPLVIPKNAVVKVAKHLNGEPLGEVSRLLNGEPWVEVEWQGRQALMFLIDLQERGSKISTATA